MKLFGTTERSYSNLTKKQISKTAKKPKVDEETRLLEGASTTRKKTVLKFVMEKLFL